jgi:hypothetical protein
LWDGTSTFGDFGASGFSGWGQSFKVPATDTHLDTFTFRLQSAISQNQPVTYSMHLYPFRDAPSQSPFVITGPEVYASDVRTMAPGTTTFRAEQFTPNVTLTAGGTYLALLYAENHATAGGDSRLRLGWVGEGYPNGFQRTTQPSNGNLAHLVACPGWGGGGGDLAFTATFSAVPEPGAVMTASALIALFGGRSLTCRVGRRAGEAIRRA